MCADHGRLLGNIVKWATNEAPPAIVTGPGLLDVNAWSQKHSMTVHLENLTNPMMMKGPFHELIQIGKQAVCVRLPDGAKAKKVQLLKNGLVPNYKVNGRTVSLFVPSISDHEFMAIDFAK